MKKLKGEEESRQRHVMNALPSKLTPLGESIAVAVTQGQKKSTQSIKALPSSTSIELRGYEEYQQEERCGWVQGRFWSLAGLFCSAEKGRFLAWLPHVRSHGSLPVGSDAMTKESHRQEGGWRDREICGVSSRSAMLQRNQNESFWWVTVSNVVWQVC